MAAKPEMDQSDDRAFQLTPGSVARLKALHTEAKRMDAIYTEALLTILEAMGMQTPAVLKSINLETGTVIVGKGGPVPVENVEADDGATR